MNHKHQAFSESKLLLGSPYAFKSFSFKIKDSTERVKGLVCRRKDGHTNYYYNETFDKDRIVIHYTAGHLMSDLSVLTKTDWHVSVAYMIARSGTIFQLFNSSLWSYHLGPGTIGGNKAQSRRTIGIELCNYGFLKPEGEDLHTAYSKPGRSDVYCKLTETDQFHKIDPDFRGFKYYTSYTPAQYESLILLTKFLCGEYNIKPEILPLDKRYTAFDDVVNFDGIVSHINYRREGKFDIGPAFDWDRYEKGIKTFEVDMHESFVTEPASADLFTIEKDIDAIHPVNTAASEGDENVYGEDGPEAR